MPKLVPFSQHEAVLLLDAYLETLGSNQSRQQVVQRVSDDLRAMATNQGIEIDDVYRNTNGISFQMASMKSAYKGQTVMKPATRLFTETVKLYREDRAKYNQLLREAKSMVVNQQTTEEAFASWLSEKVSPSQRSSIWYCYHDIEAFCRKIRVLKQPLFMTTDLDVVKKVQKTVSQNKIFTITHRKRIKSIILAAQYYTAFIKERSEETSSAVDRKNSDSYSVITNNHEEAISVTAQTQIQTEDTTISDESHSTQALQTVDFMHIPELAYTRPIRIVFFGKEIQFAPTWTDAYVNLFSVIYQENSQRLSGVLSFTKSGRLDLCDKTRVHEMLDPKPINDGLFLETNHSAMNTVQRMRAVLDLCGIDYKNVIIEYESKQNATSTMPKHDTVPTSVVDTTEPSNEEQFFAYLRDTAKLSGKTCRDYITAIRIAESFAKQHGLTDCCILGNSSAGAKKVIGSLLKNDEFIALNLSHHHRYTAAFNKYIAFCQVKSGLTFERQYEAQYPSLYYKLLGASKVYDDPAGLSLERICAIIGADDKNAAQEILDHVSWATKINIGVYSFSKNIPVELDQLFLTESEEAGDPDDYSKDRFIEVLMQRYCNGMMFDSIDFDIFRETYEMLFEEKLPFDDAALEKRLRCCGILYKDRLFPADGVIDPMTKEKLFTYIDNCFASGKTVLYYKVILSDLANDLASCYTLADEGMLRAYIEFTAEKNKYFFSEKYISKERNAPINHAAEVADFLLAAGKPMTVDAVASALSHIPQEQVKYIIYYGSDYLRNSKGEFFHKDIFEVTDDELDAIASIINGYIEENEYAIWTDVWNQIKEKMPVFLENNLYLSWLGIRNALAPFYSGRFNFNAAVISMPDKRYEMKDIFQLFAKHHPSFSADDLYSLSRELDTPVALYLWAIAEVSVRVSNDLFVSREQITFDVDAVDTAISSFMAKDYICLREIDSFLSFPNVDYEWNAYLLESYVLSYSKQFMLLNNGLALNNAPGAIVKRGSAYTEFVDVCAAVLADSCIELKKDAVLNYLADQNLITQRRYKHIELAIQKAGQIRARKR